VSCDGDEVMESELPFVAGDLNGHVGEDRGAFEEVMGIHGVGERNWEREMILEFCQAIGLQLVNTMFKNDCEKRITYKSEGAATQIDFVCAS
jgi:hypothetical protein